MSTNLSPNLEVILQDRSLGSIPLDAGAVAYITGGQWGAMNKAMNIRDVQTLKRMYGSAIYGDNHITWGSIAKYLAMGIAGCKVVRAGKDDSSTRNAVKFVPVDCSTLLSWNNGTAQFRKLNAEHDRFTAMDVTVVKLEADPTEAGWAKGDILSVDGSPTITAEIEAILLTAEVDGTNAYVWLKNVEGTIAPGDVLTDDETTPAIATVSANGVQRNRLFGTYFHEAELALTAGHGNKIAVGSTIEQLDVDGEVVASAIVLGKIGNDDLRLTNVVGTFTASPIDTVDGVVLEATTAIATAVDVGDDVRQAVMIYAKYPGTVGNDIQVAMCDASSFSENYSGTSTFASEFPNIVALGTNEWAVIVTLDGGVVERFIVSTDETATRNGESLFIDSYLEKYSNYIGTISKSDEISNLDGFFTLTSLVGGSSLGVDLASAQTAYDVVFKISTNALVVGDFHELDDMSDWTALNAYVEGKLEGSTRTLYVSTLKKDAINPLEFDIDASRADYDAITSKYFIPCYEWEFYNNADIRKKYWIPCTATNVGIIIRSIINDGDIEAPAGLRRGGMTGTTQLYYNLEEGAGSPVSDLYKYGINANVMKVLDTGQTGFYFWGNRTKFNPLSDMSRINVVSALITDVKKLSSLIMPFIFEGIDEETTFASIRQTCDAGYLVNRAVQAFNRLEDDGYVFTCAYGVNNDAQTVSEKTIVVDFEVKYRTASEYIKLRISVTGSGVEFQFA